MPRVPRASSLGAAVADEAIIEDEFRVEVELAEEGHGLSLGERLRALDLDDEARERLGSRVIVTRDGSQLFLYANTRESCAEAERVVRELLAAGRPQRERGGTALAPGRRGMERRGRAVARHAGGR